MSTTNYEHLTLPRPGRGGAVPPSLVQATQRWRISLGDCETYLDDTTPPAQLSLPDLMKPIIKRAEGVLENAIAYETARRRRAELTREKHAAAGDPSWPPTPVTPE